MVEGLASLGELYVRSIALVNPCLKPFHFVPSILSSISLTISHYSCGCFFLLLDPCSLYARCILCRIHASCMGSPFPIDHARLFLVFRGEMAKRPKRCYRPLWLIFGVLTGVFGAYLFEQMSISRSCLWISAGL